MSQTQRQLLSDRIVQRFNNGMHFDVAVKEVLHWFGKMAQDDVIWITCEAGRQTVGRM